MDTTTPLTNGVEHTVETTPKAEDTKPRSSLSDSPYCKAVRAVNRLRDLGIDRMNQSKLAKEFKISLPKIVLIGNQSSGKSALVEALSRIKVPRDPDSCTRCPIEIRLNETSPPDSDWRCNVSLQRQEAANGERSLIHFESTTEADKVESILRRAQLAILNPEQVDVFRIEGSEEGVVVKGGSEDTIIVEILGAEMTITFLDLPGVVATETEEGYKDLVRRLTEQYVRDSNTLILLTISMKTDIGLSLAADIVTPSREEDPDGRRQRVIGVLTMPDAIQKGEEAQWPAVFHNQTLPLEYGYYMTKQPGTTERRDGVSWKKAREDEKEYFDDFILSWPKREEWEPWLGVKGWEQRLGTNNLSEALSRLLSKMIAHSLPQLEASIERRLKTIDTTLGTMPQNIEDPQEAQRSLTTACGDFVTRIRSITDRNPLEIRRIYENLGRKLAQTQPKFNVFKDSDKQFSALRMPNTSGAIRQLGKWTFNEGMPFSMLDIDTITQYERTVEVGSHVPWAVSKVVMSAALDSWKDVCLRSFSELVTYMKSVISTLVEEMLFNYNPKFKDDVRVMSLGMLDTFAKATHGMIKKYCEWEVCRPMTLYDVAMRHWENRFEAHLCQYRYMVKEDESTPVTNGGTALSVPVSTQSQCRQEPKDKAPAAEDIFQKEPDAFLQDFEGFLVPPPTGVKFPKMSAIGKFCSEDPAQPLLPIICRAAAYFPIASRRIIDVIPMCIENEFLLAFGGALNERLATKLGLIGRTDMLDVCTTYAAEDPEVQKRRRRLKDEKKILEQALEILGEIGK